MNSSQANDEITSVRHLPRCPVRLVLIGLLASACVGTPAARHYASRELPARPFGLINMPTLGATGEIQDEPPEEGEEGEDGEENRNRIGLFLGVTHKPSEDNGSFGLEYERRLSDLFGIGLLWESSPSLRERVLALPALFLHPVGGLGVLLAPGVEHEEGEDLFLFRVGLSWDFELGGGFTLAPGVNYDFVEGPNDAFVYGFVVSYGF